MMVFLQNKRVTLSSVSQDRSSDATSPRQGVASQTRKGLCPTHTGVTTQSAVTVSNQKGFCPAHTGVRVRSGPLLKRVLSSMLVFALALGTVRGTTASSWHDLLPRRNAYYDDDWNATICYACSSPIAFRVMIMKGTRTVGATPYEVYYHYRCSSDMEDIKECDHGTQELDAYNTDHYVRLWRLEKKRYFWGGQKRGPGPECKVINDPLNDVWDKWLEELGTEDEPRIDLGGQSEAKHWIAHLGVGFVTRWKRGWRPNAVYTASRLARRLLRAEGG